MLQVVPAHAIPAETLAQRATRLAEEAKAMAREHAAVLLQKAAALEEELAIASTMDLIPAGVRGEFAMVAQMLGLRVQAAGVILQRGAE